MRSAVLAVAFGLVACSARGPAPAGPSAPPVSTPTVPDQSPEPGDDRAEPDGPSYPAGIAPPPFSPDQLRAGLPAGTELRLRITQAGKPPVIQHWRFTAADAQGCTIHARTLADDGSLLSDDGSGTSTWAELATHAHFPAARTTRSRSSVEVAAGRFQTWLFEVRPETPGGPTKRLHFSPELPGPPVLMEVVEDGATVLRMELLSRSQP